jgi:hypothetical protein
MILVSFSRFDRTRGAKDQIFRTYASCQIAESLLGSHYIRTMFLLWLFMIWFAKLMSNHTLWASTPCLESGLITYTWLSSYSVTFNFKGPFIEPPGRSSLCSVRAMFLLWLFMIWFAKLMSNHTWISGRQPLVCSSRSLLTPGYPLIQSYLELQRTLHWASCQIESLLCSRYGSCFLSQ